MPISFVPAPVSGYEASRHRVPANPFGRAIHCRVPHIRLDSLVRDTRPPFDTRTTDSLRKSSARLQMSRSDSCMFVSPRSEQPSPTGVSESPSVLTEFERNPLARYSMLLLYIQRQAWMLIKRLEGRWLVGSDSRVFQLPKCRHEA